MCVGQLFGRRRAGLELYFQYSKVAPPKFFSLAPALTRLGAREEAPSCIKSECTVNSERVRRDEEAATGA